MMKLSLFDLHCDTAGEMLNLGQSLSSNTLAVSLEYAKQFERYVQIMAFWTPHHMNDEDGWNHFRAMLQNLKNDPAVSNGNASIDTNLTENETISLLLAVEDVRILAEKIERLDILYREGVRVITPMWKDVTSIGGAHNTSEGLTEFGKQALDYAASLGMILDISHASRESAEEIFVISQAYRRPVIASHSNSYQVCPVSRNLHDDQVQKILTSGGVIGLNLFYAFLKEAEEQAVSVTDLFPHIDHFLELGAENILCLGCDMDGAILPREIPNLGALPKLAELMLQHNYSEDLIRKIFYENAYRFAKRNLISQ